MFNVEGNVVSLSRGDTGAIRINTETDYVFAAEDRVLFSIKNANGEVVRQQAYALDENKGFQINFRNSDTDSLAAGTYYWDLRYVIHPYYDADGNIIDGDQVITPMNINLLQVVGEV